MLSEFDAVMLPTLGIHLSLHERLNITIKRMISSTIFESIVINFDTYLYMNFLTLPLRKRYLIRSFESLFINFIKYKGMDGFVANDP